MPKKEQTFFSPFLLCLLEDLRGKSSLGQL